MEAICPATAPDGARKSTSCPKPIAPGQSMPTKRALRSTPRLRLCPLQAVLVDDDMKILDLPCQGFWDLDRERLRLLRKQSALDVSVGNPDDLAIVVVKAGDDMG